MFPGLSLQGEDQSGDRLSNGDARPELKSLTLCSPLAALELLLNTQREALSPAEYMECLKAAEQRLNTYLQQATAQSDLTLETIHRNTSSALSSASDLSSASEVTSLRPSKLTKSVLELPRDREFSFEGLKDVLPRSEYETEAKLRKKIDSLAQQGVLVQTAPDVWKLADKEFRLRESSREQIIQQRREALKNVLVSLENWVRDNPREAYAEGTRASRRAEPLPGEALERFVRRTYLVGFCGGYRGTKAHTGLYPRLLAGLLETTPHRYFQTLVRSIVNDTIMSSVRSFKPEISLNHVSSRLTRGAAPRGVTASKVQEYLVKLVLDPRRDSHEIWKEVTGASRGVRPRSLFKDIIREQGRQRAKAACAVLYENWSVSWGLPPSMMRFVEARFLAQMSVKEVRQLYNWTNGMYGSMLHKAELALPALVKLSPRMSRQ